MPPWLLPASFLSSPTNHMLPVLWAWCGFCRSWARTIFEVPIKVRSTVVEGCDEKSRWKVILTAVIRCATLQVIYSKCESQVSNIQVYVKLSLFHKLECKSAVQKRNADLNLFRVKSCDSNCPPLGVTKGLIKQLAGCFLLAQWKTDTPKGAPAWFELRGTWFSWKGHKRSCEVVVHTGEKSSPRKPHVTRTRGTR